MKINLQTQTKDLCAYNLWANHELASRITDQALPVKLPEVSQKLACLLSAEERWIRKMKQEELSVSAEQVVEGAIDALLKDLVVQSQNLLYYVSELSEDGLKEKVSFEIPGAGDVRMSRYEMVQHTVGDSAQHRGELAILVV